MNAYIMTGEQIRFYAETLCLEKRCEATIQKYIGAVTAFFAFLPEDKCVSAETALAWKAEIIGKFSASTVNVMIAAVNRFFACVSWDIRLTSAPVLVTKNGKPLNRFNIWKELQRLCADAGVDRRKVFPHNLRHLFAVTFYWMEKDIAKLTDLLGHASINTTRIYII